MKHSRIAAALCLLLAAVTAAGCASGGADTTAAQITETTETAEAATTAEEVTEPESVTTEETPEDPGELVIWQPGEKRCAFSVVYDKKSDEDVTAAADDKKLHRSRSEDRKLHDVREKGDRLLVKETL